HWDSDDGDLCFDDLAYWGMTRSQIEVEEAYRRAYEDGETVVLPGSSDEDDDSLECAWMEEWMKYVEEQRRRHAIAQEAYYSDMEIHHPRHARQHAQRPASRVRLF